MNTFAGSLKMCGMEEKVIRRLLYFGTLEWGATTLQRVDALRKHVDHVYAVDQRIFQDEYPGRSSWQRLQIRVGGDLSYVRLHLHY